MDNKKFLGYDKKYQRDLFFENEFEDKYYIKKRWWRQLRVFSNLILISSILISTN